MERQYWEAPLFLHLFYKESVSLYHIRRKNANVINSFSNIMHIYEQILDIFLQGSTIRIMKENRPLQSE